jgi:hypothetical protein
VARPDPSSFADWSALIIVGVSGVVAVLSIFGLWRRDIDPAATLAVGVCVAALGGWLVRRVVRPVQDPTKPFRVRRGRTLAATALTGGCLVVLLGVSLVIWSLALGTRGP